MNQEHIAKLEALLFAHGEPISAKKIGEILEINENKTTTLIHDLKNELVRNERGLMMIDHNNHIQLATKPAYAHIIEKLVKGELREELTPAAQETLALIAYGGPIMKTTIEYIRGVNSSFTLRNLQIRGLVEKTASQNCPLPRSSAYESASVRVSRGNCYQVTMDFIRHLGIATITDLPEYETHRQTIVNATTK